MDKIDNSNDCYIETLILFPIASRALINIFQQINVLFDLKIQFMSIRKQFYDLS